MKLLVVDRAAKLALTIVKGTKFFFVCGQRLAEQITLVDEAAEQRVKQHEVGSEAQQRNRVGSAQPRLGLPLLARARLGVGIGRIRKYAGQLIRHLDERDFQFGERTEFMRGGSVELAAATRRRHGGGLARRTQ